MSLYQHLKREKEVADYVSATSLFLYTERGAPKGDSKEGGKRSDTAEYVTVRAHRVVPHEQLASEGFIVEVIGELSHRLFEVVALADDVPGEVFLAVPLAAVGFLEVVKFVVELHIIIDGLLTVLVAQLRIFDDIVEVVLRHEALVVPLAGESLVVLGHQLRVFLVGVDRLAEVDKIVEVVEGAEVNPQTAERAVVVLAVSADIDGGLAVAVALVIYDRFLKVGYGVAQFFESFFDSWRDVEFSKK